MENTMTCPQLQTVEEAMESSDVQLMQKKMEYPQSQIVEKIVGGGEVQRVEQATDSPQLLTLGKTLKTLNARPLVACLTRRLFAFFVLCQESGNLGLLEQPTAQINTESVRCEVWDPVENIYRARKREVVSGCIGALLCSFHDEEPSMEDWLQTTRQEVGR